MSDCESLTSLLIVDLDGESLYTEAPGDSGEVILITDLYLFILPRAWRSRVGK